jgi:hypothetical protein
MSGMFQGEIILRSNKSLLKLLLGTVKEQPVVKVSLW